MVMEMGAERSPNTEILIAQILTLYHHCGRGIFMKERQNPNYWFRIKCLLIYFFGYILSAELNVLHNNSFYEKIANTEHF